MQLERESPTAENFTIHNSFDGNIAPRLLWHGQGTATSVARVSGSLRLRRYDHCSSNCTD